LVVDDGSTDDTAAILEGLAGEFPGLRVLRKRNGGLSSARNHGIANATGEFVVLLDADDELLPFPGPLAVTGEADMVRFGIEEVGMDGTVVRHTEPPLRDTGKRYLQARFGQRSFYPPACAWAYRLDWLRAAGPAFREGLLHEDMLFTVQALVDCPRVAVLAEAGYRYFKRAGSITTDHSARHVMARVRSLGVIAGCVCDMARQHPDLDLGWWALEIIDSARRLARRAGVRRAAWAVLLMELRFFGAYGPWGRFRTRREVRYRLRRAAEEALTGR
jgi:hypothetical protein